MVIILKTFDKLKNIITLIWKDYRIYSVWAILGILIPVISNMVQIYFPKVLIEHLEVKNLNSTIYTVFIFCFAQLAIRGVQLFVTYKKYYTSEKLNLELYKLLAKSYLLTDYYHYESFEFREKMHLANKCISDKSFVNIIDSVATILSNILSIVSISYVISFLTWWIWAFVVFSIIITCICETLRANYNFKSYGEQSETEIRMLYARDRLTWKDYAKETRLFNMFDYITNTANYYINLLSEFQKLRAKKSFSIQLLLMAFDFVQRIIVYVFVVFMLFSQTISVADFSMLVAAVMSLFSINNSIAVSSVRIYDLSKYVKTFLEIVNISKNSDKRTPLKISDSFSICFDNVSFSYPKEDKKAISNISYKFDSKKIYGIVGENGSGKSTFVNLLMGLYTPTCGKIYLNENEITEFNTDDYYSLFAPVFQDYNIYGYTVEDNISMFSKSQTNIKEILDSYGLSWLDSNTFISSVYEQGIELSGGEMQKIAILRAIYKDSPVFIMDEPSSALSAKNEFELYQKLQHVFYNKTVFFISHRLASCKLCDEILVFNSGRIIESGSHDQLMAMQGKYAEMFNAQSKLYSKEVLDTTQ